MNVNRLSQNRSVINTNFGNDTDVRVLTTTEHNIRLSPDKVISNAVQQTLIVLPSDST